VCRKISPTQLSSRISASMPSFCTVYVISKGKLFLVKPGTTEVDGKTDNSAAQECIVSDISSTLTGCSSSNALVFFLKPLSYFILFFCSNIKKSETTLDKCQKCQKKNEIGPEQ
jgi:hypothetical protein